MNDARTRMLEEAYRRSRGPVAYLDESYQVPDPVVAPAETFYIFTAVIIEFDQMDELRKGLRDIAEDTYWHTTKALLNDSGRAKTREMLKFLGEGTETCIIAFQVPVEQDDHDGEVARRACYRGLAVELANGRTGAWSPVDLLLLEERNQNNFRAKDRLNHSELISERRIPQSMRLLQTSPAVERLLWLPDLVSSAYRRSITHRDDTRTLFDAVKHQVHYANPID